MPIKTAKTDQNDDPKTSRPSTEPTSLSHKLNLHWSTQTKIAAAALGAVTLFYAQHGVAQNMHDSLASCATSIVGCLPSTIGRWANAAVSAVGGYLPSLQRVSDHCRGAWCGALPVALGTLAWGGTGGFELSLQGRIGSEHTVESGEAEESSDIEVPMILPKDGEVSQGLWRPAENEAASTEVSAWQPEKPFEEW